MQRVVASEDPMIDAGLLGDRLDAEVTVEPTDSEAALVDAAADADAIVVDVNTPVPEAIFEACPDLDVVARAGVGIENIDVGAAAEHSVAVTNVPDYCTEEVATHTVALLFDCIRGVAAYDRDTEADNWGWDRGRPLYRTSGRTLGLVSFGPIARQVRAQLRGFDIEVVAHDPYVDREAMAETDVRKVRYEDLLAQADYVSLHAPLTDTTREMVDAPALDRMQDHAVLVNTGRGGLVDEDALATALRDDTIAAAGLDVLQREPPQAENTLVGLDNCIVTPHAAWYSVEAREDLNTTVAANLRAGLAGETPPDYIDPDTEWL